MSSSFATAEAARGVVYVAPPTGFALVSDIDDTVVKTFVTDKARMAREVLLKNARQLEPVEGAAAAALAATFGDELADLRGKRVVLLLCGGNIDTRLLGIVLQRQLVREQRLVTLRFEITDLPGTLGRIAGLIGESGANIIDVTHHRLFLDVPAKAADLDFTIETRDADHTAVVEAALQAAGLMPRRLSSSGS